MSVRVVCAFVMVSIGVCVLVRFFWFLSTVTSVTMIVMVKLMKVSKVFVAIVICIVYKLRVVLVLKICWSLLKKTC